MSGGGSYKPKTRLGAVVHSIEESVIAILLGLMTLVTFVNVVMRYGFNSQLIWGLEAVLVLFAWLVLFGIPYGFKVISHLGVDALINLLKPGPRRMMGLLAALCCLFYAVLLMKGAWDYWAPFANLSPTSGHWFPTGFEQVRGQGWYESEQLRFPWGFGQTFMENAFNEGERYEKLPRLIPYAMLPFAMALLVFRIAQLIARILRGDIDTIIVSHEAEDAVAEAGKDLAKET